VPPAPPPPPSPVPSSPMDQFVEIGVPVLASLSGLLLLLLCVLLALWTHRRRKDGKVAKIEPVDGATMDISVKGGYESAKVGAANNVDGDKQPLLLEAGTAGAWAGAATGSEKTLHDKAAELKALLSDDVRDSGMAQKIADNHHDRLHDLTHQENSGGLGLRPPPMLPGTLVAGQPPSDRDIIQQVMETMVDKVVMAEQTRQSQLETSFEGSIEALMRAREAKHRQQLEDLAKIKERFLSRTKEIYGGDLSLLDNAKLQASAAPRGETSPTRGVASTRGGRGARGRGGRCGTGGRGGSAGDTAGDSNHTGSAAGFVVPPPPLGPSAVSLPPPAPIEQSPKKRGGLPPLVAPRAVAGDPTAPPGPAFSNGFAAQQAPSEAMPAHTLSEKKHRQEKAVRADKEGQQTALAAGQKMERAASSQVPREESSDPSEAFQRLASLRGGKSIAQERTALLVEEEEVEEKDGTGGPLRAAAGRGGWAVADMESEDSPLEQSGDWLSVPPKTPGDTASESESGTASPDKWIGSSSVAPQAPPAEGTPAFEEESSSPVPAVPSSTRASIRSRLGQPAPRPRPPSASSSQPPPTAPKVVGWHPEGEQTPERGSTPSDRSKAGSIQLQADKALLEAKIENLALQLEDAKEQESFMPGDPDVEATVIETSAKLEETRDQLSELVARMSLG